MLRNAFYLIFVADEYIQKIQVFAYKTVYCEIHAYRYYN